MCGFGLCSFAKTPPPLRLNGPSEGQVQHPIIRQVKWTSFTPLWVLTFQLMGCCPDLQRRRRRGKKVFFFKMKHIPLSLMDSTSDVQMFIHYPWSCSKTFPLLQDVTTGWFNNRALRPHDLPDGANWGRTKQKGFEMLLGSGEWLPVEPLSIRGQSGTVFGEASQLRMSDCFWLVPLER